MKKTIALMVFALVNFSVNYYSCAMDDAAMGDVPEGVLIRFLSPFSYLEEKAEQGQARLNQCVHSLKNKFWYGVRLSLLAFTITSGRLAPYKQELAASALVVATIFMMSFLKNSEALVYDEADDSMMSAQEWCLNLLNLYPTKCPADEQQIEEMVARAQHYFYECAQNFPNSLSNNICWLAEQIQHECEQRSCIKEQCVRLGLKFVEVLNDLQI